MFTIVVHGMPSFRGQLVDDQSHEAGTDVEPLELPAAAGGNGELTYSLEGDLPGELEFNRETRTIEGTLPQAELYAAEPYALTYWVTGCRGRCSGVELHDCGEWYAQLRR